MALNDIASFLATVSQWEGEVKLWNVSHGLSTSVFDNHALMHPGTLLHDMLFTRPTAALFLNHDPNKVIMACTDGILMVDVSTRSTQPFCSTPRVAYYYPHALALSDNDVVLVAGSFKSVCGYDTASRTRLWIHGTASHVGAVCILGAHVLLTLAYSYPLALDYKTGAQIAALQKVKGSIRGLGVIEGLLFSFFLLDSHLSDHHTSVYLAMLQHLLDKQAQPLYLPLEMWDWIEKYRV